jgi:hypothetical protein
MRRASMRRFLIVGLLAALMPPFLSAVEVNRQAIIANETGLAYNTKYPIDISNAKTVAMQVNYTSATFVSKTFSDGTSSTGSLTVVSYLALSSATASANATVVSTQGLVGQQIFIAGQTLYEGKDFSAKTSVGATACSISDALAANTVFLTTCTWATAVIGSTAPTYGTFYNGASLESSSGTAFTKGTFSGGRDNQWFSINGTKLTANKDFYPKTSTTVTATAIAAAINANATLSPLVTALAIGAVVTSTGDTVGVATNCSVVSSSSGALLPNGAVTLSGSQGTAAMTGGTNAAFNYNSANIAIPSHGFTTALPVLFSIGGATAGGLVNQTTYYVVVVDANNIKLSSTSAVAQTGNGITVTSTATQTTADTLTLAPLAISGTPSFKMEVSNDQTNWTALTTTVYNVAVSSITMSSYTLGGATSIWDLGQVGYNWFRLNVIAPTQGGILLKAFMSAKP